MPKTIPKTKFPGRFTLYPLLFFLLTSLPLFFPTPVRAVCPVCTVAVVGGLGLSRWLGIDDTISGVWVGGLILSSSLWLFDWLTKKYPKLHTTFYILLTTFLMYLIVLLPLAWSDIINHPLNKIFGVDKLVFGTGVGSLAFLTSIWADKKIRAAKGKQLFNYQKVVLPISFLVIISLVLYLVLGVMY